MSHTESTIFAVVLTVAVFAFLLSAWRLARFIRLGRPDLRLRGELPRRLATMFQFAFAQKRVRAECFGWNHFFLFWGFMILFLANAEFVISGLFPSLNYHLLGGFLYGVATLAFDVVTLMVLVCVIIAYYRRLVVKPDYIEYDSRDGYFVLGLVGGLMIAFYGMHGGEIASGHAHGAVMPVSRLIVAPVMGAIFGHGAALHVATRLFWWIHAFIFLFFLNYLPYSKHMHILTAIPNVYCRAWEPVATVPREEFAPNKKYGAARIDQFSWKDLLDFTACTECGRCNANCPATQTKKPLNPRYLVHDGKVNLLANGEKIRHGNLDNGLQPLIGKSEDIEGTVGEASIWSCTTCGACMANCPVFIEHVPKIVKMRRHLVQNEARFPHELNIFFDAIEQRSNPWGIAPSDRAKWAKDSDVPLFTAENPAEYLFFVGCAGAFDARNKKVAVAFAKTLKAAGVSFGILGIDEKCCGDSLRRLGNEFVFERMAKENVELFKQRGVKKIVTYCPHCYTTLKNDYKQYGLNIPVIHHTELLTELLANGRLPLNPTDGFGRVLYHDSCYLGRYNGIYRQPRQILEKTTGRKPLEMDRVFEKSFCCGAGGGRMWMEEEPEHRINANRVREALTKKPDCIAVACPYCMTMFEDGVKDEKVADKVKVLDIAEIVAAKLA